MNNAFELRPRRIGEIIDRGIDLIPRLVLDPPILILLILSAAVAAGANYIQLDLQQAGGFWTKIVLSAAWLALLFLSIVVSQCFTAMTVIKGGQIWVGQSKTIRMTTEAFTAGNLFRLVGLNIYLVIVSFLLLVLFIIPSLILFGLAGHNYFFGLLSFFLLILSLIPSLIYYCNRALAPVALLIEDSDIIPSIRRSKLLMTYHPHLTWYSPRTPMFRISGLLFVMWIINLLPGVLAGASTGAFTAQLTGAPPGPPSMFQFMLVFLSQLVVFSAISLGTLTLVGFYFDLRTRCEGLDLQEQALALKQGGLG